jgi:ethanolamine transporter EutH
MSSSVIGGVVAVVIAVLVAVIASRRQKHTKDNASK